MPATSGKSLEELLAIKKGYEDAGTWNPAGSKSHGKIENAIIAIRPNPGNQFYSQETVDSAKAKLATSTEPPAPELGALGAGGSGAGGGINLQSIYDNELKSSGVAELEKELTAKKAALLVAQNNVNDNPFYSEATRLGRLAKIDERSQAELNNLQNTISQKRADAQVKVNIATQQYNIDDNEYKNQLNRLNLLISSGAITGASSNDISQIAMATGISTAMVKSIINTTKQAQKQLQLATNDNGDVTIFDANTGEVVNVVKGVGNKQTGGGGGGGGGGTLKDTEVGVAISALKKADTMNAGGEDKLVAAWEIQAAYQELLEKYGDPEKAKQLLISAMDRGGYSEWRP